MNPQQIRQEAYRQVPPASAASEAVAAAIAQAAIQPCSPRFFFSSAAAANPSAGSHRRIAIPVDLSDESAYAVKWAVQNYLRPGDAVILLHVCTTSVLYGADWGAIDISVAADATAARGDGAGSEESKRKLEENLEAFTTAKAQEIAKPLVEAQIPYKIHIVKDHDMKERLCLEVERLGLSAVIMGSRGFGAARRSDKGGLGSFSDYCVHHCICPVVVVRYPDEEVGVSTVIGNEAPPEIAAKLLKLNQSPEEDKLSDSPSKHKVRCKDKKIYVANRSWLDDDAHIYPVFTKDMFYIFNYAQNRELGREANYTLMQIFDAQMGFRMVLLNLKSGENRERRLLDQR